MITNKIKYFLVTRHLWMYIHPCPNPNQVVRLVEDIR